MRCAIVLNAPQLTRSVTEDIIICADGGYRHIAPKRPLCIVGDFDSLRTPPPGVDILRHPAEKNETDGALAVRHAVALGYRALTLYGALGGRIDHVLGNIALLPLAASLGAAAVIAEGACEISFWESGSHSLPMPKGTTFSILPYGGDAVVTEARGVHYPLENLLLSAKGDGGRGISNIATAENISFRITQGSVLVIINRDFT